MVLIELEFGIQFIFTYKIIITKTENFRNSHSIRFSLPTTAKTDI